MGDTEWETFDASAVEWVAFDRADQRPAVELVTGLLRGSIGSSLVRIEGPEPPRAKGLRGWFAKVERQAAQVVAGRQGAPIVLTVGAETNEAVATRFQRAGIALPDGWSFAAPEGTFPWVEAPPTSDPEAVVAFVVDALAALAAVDGRGGGRHGGGEWRVGVDTPRMVEHSHGPHGTHRHAPGEHHHH